MSKRSANTLAIEADRILRELLSENLMRLRKAKGLSQGATAKKAGLPAANISRIENLKYSPSAVTIRLLMQALETDANSLLQPYSETQEVQPPQAELTQEEKVLLDFNDKFRRASPMLRTKIAHLLTADSAGTFTQVHTSDVPFDEEVFFSTGQRVRSPTLRNKKTAKT